jgi:UPF0755 protein
LVAKFINGDVIIHTLTFLEGTTFNDALALMAQNASLKHTLVGKTQDELIAILANGNTSLEGLFFPDTYHFTANLSDVALLKKASTVMQSKLNAAWESRDPDIILKSPYEALILASIIEKETSLDDERSLVSGVFQRRLAKNMRLQADPTVAYGLGKDLVGSLKSAHLKQDTPYNTYLHKGLPPTPIALPSMKSIQAALHPDKGNALYFVAIGNGRHQFSENLDEHNLAVARYRQTQLIKTLAEQQSSQLTPACQNYLSTESKLCSYYLQ